LDAKWPHKKINSGAHQQCDVGYHYDVVEAALGVKWQKVVVLFLLEADRVVGLELHPHLFK
jgi:hypothetical protein